MEDAVLSIVYAVIGFRIRLFASIKPHWQYLKYVLRHKKYVWIFGRKLDLGMWRLLVHDISKFTLKEWYPYVDFFYGPKVPCCTTCKHPLWESEDDVLTCNNLHCSNSRIPATESTMLPPISVRENFTVAMHLHQLRNDHHWQWYLFHPTRPDIRWELWHQDTKPVVYSIPERRVYLEPVTPKYAVHDVEVVVQALNMAPQTLFMPDEETRELVADWAAANVAQGNDLINVLDWWQNNKANIRFHPDTEMNVEMYLARVVNTTR